MECFGNVGREDSQSLAFQAIKQTLAVFFLGGGQLHELPIPKFHALLFSGNPWKWPSQHFCIKFDPPIKRWVALNDPWISRPKPSQQNKWNFSSSFFRFFLMIERSPDVRPFWGDQFRAKKTTTAKKEIFTRWFKVPFSSPSWRSLNPLKGWLKHPKKVTLNHQVIYF